MKGQQRFSPAVTSHSCRNSFLRAFLPWLGALACCHSEMVRSEEASGAPRDQTATAQQPTPPAQVTEAANWSKPRPGLQLQMTLSQEVLSSLSGGFRRGTIYEGLLQAGFGLDLEKLAGWHGATFLANGYYAFGDSLTQRFTRDLNVVSNIDAYDSPRLFELWLQQTVMRDHLSARAGLLAVDSEFFVVESAALFINSAFGAAPYLTLNLDSPTFPLTAPAVRLAWDSQGAWLLRAGVYSADLGSPSGSNRHGTRFAFSSQSGVLAIGEGVYQWPGQGPPAALPGKLKLGGYYDTGEFDSLEGRRGRWRGVGAAYAILDQALYRPAAAAPPASGKETAAPKASLPDDHGLNGFLRLAWSGPEERALTDYNLQAGLTWKGLLPGRADDTAGLGVSETQLSPEARVVNGERVTAHHEVILEATWQAALAEHLTLQPDLQIVFNPGGIAHVATAVVAGARLTLSF